MNEVYSPADHVNFDVGDILRALFRNKRKVIVVPLLILGLAVLAILFAPRKYRSEAKLFMQVGRESVKLDPTATTGDTISMQTTDRNNGIVTVIDTLKSRGLIEKVVDHLGANVVLGEGDVGEQQSNLLIDAAKTCVGTLAGWYKSIDPISDREEAVILIERHLSVEAENDSTLITAHYDAESPELAQLVTQTLVDLYREEHLRLHRTSGSKEFFAEQHDELKQRLDTSVDKLRQAKNRMNIVSIESRRSTLEARIAEIELSLNNNLQQLVASRARVTDIKKQLSETPERVLSAETIVPNTGTDMLRNQVFQLEVLMLDQQAKYSDDHPSLRATREQLREAQAKLQAQSDNRQQTTNDINPNHRTLSLTLAQEESQLAGVVAQNNKLNEQREQVVADLTKLNNFELEFDQLQRESELARIHFMRAAQDLQKAKTNDDLDRDRITNAIEYQTATLAEKPVSPSKLLISVLAVLLSGFSVVSLVLISEKLSPPIYKTSQLEAAMQLPVFGVLPEQKRSFSTAG